MGKTVGNLQSKLAAGGSSIRYLVVLGFNPKYSNYGQWPTAKYSGLQMT